MPRHTDNTWLERIAGYLKNSNGALSGSADNNAPTQKVGGVYSTATITYADGSRVALQMDANGNLKTTLATLIAGEDSTNNVLKVEERFSYLNIAAGQATTAVKASAGFLHTITFNSAATATNTTVVYDNPSTSGTVIARPAATTATVPTTLTYDVAFVNGLTIITTTANGSDMTVSYR